MKAFFKKNLHILFEICSILLMSLTPLIWFDPQKMVLGVDSGYPINFIDYFWQRSFTWLSSINFGVDMTTFMGLIPFHGFQALIRFVGVPFYSVEKVTFVFWFFVMALSMYFLIHYLYPQRHFWILRLTTVIFYSFNLYIFSFWLNGEQTTFSVYALLPVLILILLRFLREEISIFKTSLYLNLSYFFLSAGGITGVPLLASPIVAITLTFFIFLLFSSKKTLLRTIKRSGILILYVIPFFVFLNAYWLFPFLANFKQEFSSSVQGNGGLGGNISWINYISKYTSYMNLFRVQGDNNWYEHPGFYSNNYFTNPFLIVGSYLFPIFAYSSILFIKEKREKIIVLLFILMSLVGIFFSAGSHDPFGFIYIFMMNHIPGFIAFRSAYYKFVVDNYFAFSILIGISTYYFIELLLKGKLRYVVWLVLMLLLLFYNYPFFQKSSFIFNAPFTTMVKIPNYVLDFKNYDNSKENDYRTLVVPSLNKDYTLQLYSWGYYSGSPLFPAISHNSFVYYQAGLSDRDKNILSNLYEFLATKQYDKFLRMTQVLDIHNVLLTNDVVTNYGFSFTELPSTYKNAIESSHLFHVAWQEGPWTLYSLNQQSAKVFASNSFDVYQGDVSHLYDTVSTNPIPVISQEEQSVFTFPVDKSKSIIQNFTCLSCTLFVSGIKPELPTTYFLPGSFIYELKQSKENKDLSKAQLPEIRSPLLLQLSVKHIGELLELVQGHPQNITITKWQTETDQLSSYMDQVNDIIPQFISTNNFVLLQQIDTYLSVVSDTTINIYNITHEKFDPNLQIAITNLLGKENELINKTRGYLNPFLNGKSYTFAINNTNADQTFSIPLDTLPTDIHNNPIVPSFYTSDTKNITPSTTIQDKQLFINGIPKDSKILTLHFDSVVNFATNASLVEVPFADGVRNCLMTVIPDYSWRNTYNISVDNTVPVSEGDVYVSADYPVKIGIPESNKSQYLNYVNNYHFSFENNSNKRMIFYGNQDYTSATVYFCPKFPDDIKNLTNDISVTKLTQPVLYAESVNSSPQNSQTAVITKMKKINPTEYRVDVENANSSYLLGFLEAFSPEWKLYDANNKEVFAPHVVLYGYANGWYIANAGSNVFYIRFVTQNLFVVGVWISIISFSIISLITVSLILYQKSHKKT